MMGRQGGNNPTFFNRLLTSLWTVHNLQTQLSSRIESPVIPLTIELQTSEKMFAEGTS